MTHSVDLPSGVRLVIVGHLGFAEERTPYGVATGPGGAGYACARGGAVVEPRGIGLVAAVGKDYDFAAVDALGIDLRGVQVVDGDTPRFGMVQHRDGRRTPDVELGTASVAALRCFPAAYVGAQHIHIATAPPSQQLEWLHFLRARPERSIISVDSFELYASAEPDLSREVCRSVDLIFMNQKERELLFGDDLPTGIPVVTKLGPRGAIYHSPTETLHVPTEPMDPVDTTGAGEILAGVFLALRTVLEEPLPALRAAVRAATASVTEFGVDGPRLRHVLEEIHTNLRHTRPGGQVCKGTTASQRLLNMTSL